MKILRDELTAIVQEIANERGYELVIFKPERDCGRKAA